MSWQLTGATGNVARFLAAGPRARGASPADGELTRQIPWLRVFVEGVVIVAPLAGE